ncbi:MAG: HAMP domain-containing protein [Verrucomicrobia subdivision 3 bacterium]|nr:HAMP domain-containing protein [Verrucomicrobiota bacterium]MCC6820385.1 HAMP domain-containing protein [Limisphaerales bacterium]
MLRARIFLSLIPRFAILIGVSALVLFWFARMAGNIGQTVLDNYQSEVAAQNLRVTLARMDAALQRSRTEDKAPMREMFEMNAQLFRESLESQFTNRAIVPQFNLLIQLRTNFQALCAVGLEMLDPAASRSEQRDLYDLQIIPRTGAINPLLERIHELTQENIVTNGRKIQRINRTIPSLLLLALVLALGISGYASFKLDKAILKPIQTLTNAAREIGHGNLEQTVPVLSNDELGELAVTFNKMAAQLNTYRQSTTEQILRLHRTMEAALASFSDPVFIMDTQGRIELNNRAAQTLSAQLALNGALPPRLAEATAAVLRSNQDFLPDSFDEVLTLRVSGEEKSFLPRIHLMRETDTRPVGVAVVLHDVTRFRLLDDAKTNLVATVSHELKTPLTSVRMVLHLLLEKSLGPLTKKQDELVTTARKDSERLIRILDELLDIARLEAGAASLVREPVHPADLVQFIVDEARRSAAEAGVTLTPTVEPGLPPVLVDRQKIGHVFHNFITNAIKYSPRGAQIHVSANSNADRGVQFSVRDQGPGIAAEFQVRIFDRFFRVPGQMKRGAGLGLTIAREVVVAHGGRVGVRSQPGQGSEFYFVLDGTDPMA